MKASKSISCLAILFAVSLFAPVRSFADTYSIFSLNSDNRQFYGMDDSGQVVLYGSFYSCGNPASGCYETFTNGAGPSRSSTAPILDSDYNAVICDYPKVTPCMVSDNGYTATISSSNGITDYLSVFSSSDPSQLLAQTMGITGTFAINGSGDIVFDSGFYDEWYEAVDESTPPATPEPGSIYLLATGALALAGLMLYRRRPA